MIHSFSPRNFRKICDQLAIGDPDLKWVIETYGYPPMWTRPNTFATLVHIILEQQVSLASAKSALNKLQERLKKITPANVLSLTDEEFKSCYFSRQKTGYVRYLAGARENKGFDLKGMEKWPDEKVRAELVSIRGIGNWTADVYMMFALQRADIFPIGDLAAVNALKQLKNLKKPVSREALLKLADTWKPYRTIATMILWHYYLSLRAKKKDFNQIK